MDADLHATVKQHAELLADHDKQLVVLQETKKHHEDLINRLDEDIVNLKSFIPTLATKDDISLIHHKLDNGMNLTIQTMRDAINANPQKEGNKIHFWGVVVGVISVVLLLVTYLHGAH